MKLVIQRVNTASVFVDGSIISHIGKGLLVLVGISDTDSKLGADALARKIINIRLFDHDDQNALKSSVSPVSLIEETRKLWKHNVVDSDASLLLVPQFTLIASFKGNRPNFGRAMHADRSQALFDYFVETVRRNLEAVLCERPELTPAQLNVSRRVQVGEFGSHMVVSLQNDGPATFVLDYPFESNSQGQHQVATKLLTRQTGSRQKLDSADGVKNVALRSDERSDSSQFVDVIDQQHLFSQHQRRADGHERMNAELNSTRHAAAATLFGLSVLLFAQAFMIVIATFVRRPKNRSR